MSTRLGGIIGCKNKASSWHLNGFPDGSNIGSTVQCRGEAHCYTGTPKNPFNKPKHSIIVYNTAKTIQKQCMVVSN